MPQNFRIMLCLSPQRETPLSSLPLFSPSPALAPAPALKNSLSRFVPGNRRAVGKDERAGTLELCQLSAPVPSFAAVPAAGNTQLLRDKHGSPSLLFYIQYN